MSLRTLRPVGRHPRVVLATLLALLLLAACGGGAESEDSAASGGDTAAPAEEGEEAAAGGDEESIVVYYSTRPEEGLAPLEEAFEEAHPEIDLQIIRGSSSDTVARVLTEASAGQQQADLTELNALPMAELADAGILVPLPESILEGLPDQAVDPEGRFAGTRYFGHMLPYNPEMVPEAEYPENHESFLDPYWKGNFLVGANDVEWAYQVFAARGEEEGRAFLEQIAAQEPQIRDEGRGAIAELVAIGQVQAADMTLDYHVTNRQEEGLPIDGAPFDPPLLNIDWIATFEGAPHPQSTIVFLEWLYSEDGIATDAELGFNRIGDEGTEDALADPETIILAPESAELQRKAAEVFQELFPIL